jgi:6-hydroxy-3-succinoylpyridine 3-monooxygenase
VRTKIYIDGYNLYYGCLKGTGYKWLDLHKLFFNQILPSSAPSPSELIGIKFFTAPILEKASKALDSVSSQSRYHTALQKLYPNEIEVIKGYYAMTHAKAKIVDAEDPNKWPRDCQDILVWKLEEKQSDVSLALHAYHDAVVGNVDQVVIVTNDTDIAPALQMIRAHTTVQIGAVKSFCHHRAIPRPLAAIFSRRIWFGVPFVQKPPVAVLTRGPTCVAARLGASPAARPIIPTANRLS